MGELLRTEVPNDREEADVIFSSISRDEPDMLFTPVKIRDRYVLVGMDAQELFMEVLGEDEWNKRCEEAYERETGQSVRLQRRASDFTVHGRVQRLIRMVAGEDEL